MNRKNLEIVGRIACYICDKYHYDYFAVKYTIGRCFEVKQDYYHIPDKNKGGVLVIEDAIYMKSKGIIDEYELTDEEYKRRVYYEYIERLERLKINTKNIHTWDIHKSINGTIDILMNASNIQDIISKWKENNLEAYKNYHSK